MNFYEWVSQETAAYGSQKKAGEAYGVGQSQWGRYLRGAAISDATLARLRERSGLALVVEPPDEDLEHVDQVDEDDPERAELLELHAEIDAEGEADEQASAREAGELLAEGLALVIARGDHPKAGWLHYRRGVFCDVQTGECAEFDRRSYPNGEDRTGLSMAVRVDLVRRFPRQAFAPPHQHGVDGWLRSWASMVSGGSLECVELDSEAHRAGAVYCDGARAGHLSAHRPTMYDAAPFARVPVTDAARALRARWAERAR